MVDSEHRGMLRLARVLCAAGCIAGASPGEARDKGIYSFVDENGIMNVTNVPRSRTLRPASPPAAVGSPTARAELTVAARASRYAQLVDQTARAYDVDPALVHAVIRVESNYDGSAVSPKGAVGLMQLMPATARRYGVTNPRDVLQNVDGGIRYLRDLLQLFHHDLALALAAYNAGEAAVTRHGGVPPYAETTSYVAKVLAHYLRPGDLAMHESSIARAHAE